MRKVKIVGVVAAVACVLAAVSPSSAFAAAEWLLNGAATGKIAAETTGKWLILGLFFFGFVKTHFVCTGALVGTVGPGSAAEVTNIEGLKGEKGTINCEVLHGDLGGCPGALLVLVTAEHLPWISKLEGLEPGAITDTLTGTGGEPGFSVECTLSGGSKSSELCEGNVTTKTLVNGLNGVEVEIENQLSKACKKSGAVYHTYAAADGTSTQGILTVSK